jgi:hypothetical protein
MAEIRFTVDFGAEVLVPVQGATARELRQAVLRALRQFGRLGWQAARVPPRGFRFPLALEPEFDWALLGARRATCVIDGEERHGVWFADQFYTRRELSANPRQKLGPAVKFSRGARATDGPEVVEEGDGSFRYVTLAVFRGEGRGRDEYRIPEAGSDREQIEDDAPGVRTAAAAPLLPQQDDHEALLLFIRVVGPRVPEEATFEIGGRVEALKQFTREHWSAIRSELPTAQAVATAMAAALGALHPEGR